jgi:hypothetical protein
MPARRGGRDGARLGFARRFVAVGAGLFRQRADDLLAASFLRLRGAVGIESGAARAMLDRYHDRGFLIERRPWESGVVDTGQAGEQRRGFVHRVARAHPTGAEPVVARHGVRAHHTEPVLALRSPFSDIAGPPKITGT